MNIRATIFLLVTVCLLHGCTTNPRLDPFGRPYNDENVVQDLELKTCKPTNVDKYARLISGTRPLYPVGENLSGKSGEAVLEFEVAANGSVRVISRDAQNKWFANHAEIAMSDWQVQPAYKSGQPISVACKLAFGFITYKEAERRREVAAPGKPGALEQK
jgi:Gram-negative bacterial TonB protein C-terminal